MNLGLFQCPHNSPLLFEQLNLSVLTGEYIHTGFFSEFTDAEKFLSGLPDYYSTIRNIELFSAISNILNTRFLIPLTLSFKLYRGLINTVNRILENKPGKVLFAAYKNPAGQVYSSDFLEVFEKNIKIAEIDHKFSLNNKSLSDLLLIRELFINEPQYKRFYYVNIILDKCNFLIKKLDNRFQKDSKNYLYSFDFKDKEIAKEDIKIKVFNEFDKISTNHYINYNPKSSYSISKKREIEEKWRKNTLTLKDFHFLIKHYKDCNNSDIQVDNLIKEFKKYREDFRNNNNLHFDERAMDISYNYILNNKLALLIDKFPEQEQEIYDFLKEIESVQHSTEVNNYFPFYKYSCHLINKIEQLFKSSGNEVENITMKLSLLDDILKKTYEKLDYCKEQNFVAFQLPLEDCITTYSIDNQSVNVFLSSSFYWPINYEKVKNDMDELYNAKNKFQVLLETHKAINAEKEEIVEIKRELDNKDNRSIEILSIFAAIVLFATGNIQIWQKVENLKDALLFMLTFTYSLSVFVGLLWFVTRKKSEIGWRQTVFIFAFIILGYLSFSYLINWWPFLN